MERIAIFTTEDGGEVAVQVADGSMPPTTSEQGVPSAADRYGAAPGRPDGLTVRGIPDGAVTTRGAGSARLVERTHQSLDDALARVRPAVNALVEQVRGQDEAPDEFEVEFGIQISLEVGAYIAAASSTANFRVTMRWLAGSG